MLHVIAQNRGHPWNSGINYESFLYSHGFGRAGIYYGNKGAQSLQSFSTELAATSAPAEEAALEVQLKPVESTLSAGVQLQQTINVECRREFVSDADVPNVHLHYQLAGFPRTVTIRLPCALNKFLEPTEMTSEVFFQRWKFLCTCFTLVAVTVLY